ncbi:MAG: glycyl-radical enzyme activating protein [Deltaproteobacteria bacterium]|nr:glycyl-radical enzyme activating protein [Deltaproteobacteria bacterium]
MKSKPTGIIFARQRMSVHDGPGWRTLVFLKGCALRCQWCSNPESWSSKPELAYNDSRCLGTIECDRCLAVCSEKAVFESKKGQPVQLDRDLCTNCGDCVHECPADALYMFGQVVTVEEVIRSVQEDSAFHARSEGGLTLGGGEPLLQPEFAAALLKQCREEGIHTSIETCGAVPWPSMEQVCQHVDTIHYDIKLADDQKHKEFTGVGNQRILLNLKKLAKRFPEIPVTVRTPVIPGLNDSREEIEKIIQIIGNIPSVMHYELLPYHRFGSQKYHYLGKTYPLGDLAPPSVEKIRDLYTVVPDYFRTDPT